MMIYNDILHDYNLEFFPHNYDNMDNVHNVSFVLFYIMLNLQGIFHQQVEVGIAHMNS